MTVVRDKTLKAVIEEHAGRIHVLTADNTRLCDIVKDEAGVMLEFKQPRKPADRISATEFIALFRNIL